MLYGDWRWLGSLRPLRGLLLTLVLVLPWLVTIFFISHGAFYQESLGHDFGAKLMGGEESHGEPPGYYLLAVVVSFWPATLFLIPALVLTILRHREPAARFLLAWAGTWWLIECVPTKLPNYILPAYPALAMMAAAFALAPKDEAVPRWQRNLAIGSVFYFLLGGCALVAAIVIVPMVYGTGGMSFGLVAAAVVPAVLILATAITALRGAARPAIAWATVSALALYAAITLVAAPRIDQFWVSPREAQMVAKHTEPGDPPVVLAGYTEASALVPDRHRHAARRWRDACRRDRRGGRRPRRHRGRTARALPRASGRDGSRRQTDRRGVGLQLLARPAGPHHALPSHAGASDHDPAAGVSRAICTKPRDAGNASSTTHRLLHESRDEVIAAMKTSASRACSNSCAQP